MLKLKKENKEQNVKEIQDVSLKEIPILVSKLDSLWEKLSDNDLVSSSDSSSIFSNMQTAISSLHAVQRSLDDLLS
jgi:hypothetical protein